MLYHVQLQISNVNKLNKHNTPTSHNNEDVWFIQLLFSIDCSTDK